MQNFLILLQGPADNEYLPLNNVPSTRKSEINSSNNFSQFVISNITTHNELAVGLYLNFAWRHYACKHFYLAGFYGRGLTLMSANKIYKSLFVFARISIFLRVYSGDGTGDARWTIKEGEKEWDVCMKEVKRLSNMKKF